MLEPMEVHLTAETEKKLKDLAEKSGRGTDDLVEDAMAGYFDEDLQIRETLSSRYDDLKSGRVKPIDGEEAFTRLKAKTEAERSRPRDNRNL
jgi:predicted transcriptional regulator